MTTAANLRRTIRQQRNTLTPEQQRLHADLLYSHLTTHPLFRRSRRVAGFIASDGEIDLQAILTHILVSGRSCYLPVLNQLHGNRLWFAPLQRNAPLTSNRYGIPEPSLFPPEPVPAWSLDLVLTPLVAYDMRGGRIGMGGGYYDRTFGRIRGASKRPFLLGVAHSLQQVDEIQCNPWDIPLDGIATEKGVALF